MTELDAGSAAGRRRRNVDAADGNQDPAFSIAENVGPVAANLREFADLPQFEQRQADLKSLAEELEGDDTSDSWVGIDLTRAFPLLALPGSRKPQVAEQALSFLATFVIFVPIIWTWLSFREAGQAYREMLQSRQGVGQNTFLSLWATGFDGRLVGWHQQLVGVALGSIVIITIAALLVVAQRAVVYRNQNKETELYARLTSTLIQAQRILNKRQADAPKSAGYMIRTATREVIRLQNKVEVAAGTLSRIIGEVEDTLSPLLTSITEAGEHLAATTVTAQGAAGSLSASLASTQGELNAAAGVFNEKLDTALITFGNAAQQSLTSAASVQQATVEKSSAAVQQAAAAVEKLRIQHENLTATVESLPLRNAEALAPMKAAVNDFKQQMSGWTSTLSEHNDALNLNASAVQAHVTQISDVHDITNSFLNQLQEQLKGSSANGSSPDQIGSPARDQP